MLIEQVEGLVERFYETVQIDPERQVLSGMLHARFDQMMAEGAGELADLAARRTRLEDEQRTLLQAHYAGAVPLGLLKREQDRITGSLETNEYRLTARHGHCADARANLDDSLHLAHVGDIYAHADDANRRLCNQELFTAISIDGDDDVRVGYRSPYDGLADAGLRADALTWAAQAREQGQDGTLTKGGPLIESSHLTHLGCSALRAYDPCVVGSHEHAR